MHAAVRALADCAEPVHHAAETENRDAHREQVDAGDLLLAHIGHTQNAQYERGDSNRQHEDEEPAPVEPLQNQP
jgi:hypothetical protein